MNRDPEAIWAAAMLKARRKFSNIWGMSVIVSDACRENTGFLVDMRWVKKNFAIVDGRVVRTEPYEAIE
jgi:hypothetical protein